MAKRWWQWERRKEELSEELEAHLNLAVADRVARGEDAGTARAEALRELGNVPLVEDATRRQWGWGWLERAVRDVRHAARRLRNSPGYAVTVVLTLTLAIGANTAVFGLLYALLLRSLPVERPDRIVQLKELESGPGMPDWPMDALSGKVYDAVKARQTTMSGMCAWGGAPLNLHEASGTQPVKTAAVTGDCFRTLGLHAAVGRFFGEAEDRDGGGAEGWAVVLGYNYWRQHFGGDPGVVGRVLDFQDKKGVVVGVMEPGFESVQVGDRPEIYVPSEINHEDRHNFGSQNREILGRLKPGATVAQVAAEADPIFQALFKVDGKGMVGFVFDGNGNRMQVSKYQMIAVPGRTGASYMREEFTKPLYLIEGMVGLSLLVACAYLATLAGTRAAARRRELGVRLALGASRGRLMAELLWESALLAAAGAGLGLGFAWAAGRGLQRMIASPGAGGEMVLHTDPTGMVLVFALGLTVLTVVLAGVGPAWRASRVNPNAAIKEGALRLDGRRPRRVGAWLTPLQVAVSLVIVVVATLMASTVAHLLAVDPGFRTSGVTIVAADFSDRDRQAAKLVPKEKADEAHTPMALYAALLERIRRSPGVESAAISQAYQMSGALYMRPMSSTLPTGEVRQGQMEATLTVTPGFFATMGIPLRAGRDFTDGDHEGTTKVCVLSKKAAEYFFPGQDAVGKTLNMGSAKKPLPVMVVGVVGDTMYMGLKEKPTQLVYTPFFDESGFNPYAKFLVRARTPGAAAEAVRTAFRELAPDVPLRQPVTMTDMIGNQASKERMLAVLSGFFAVLTLALSAIGIYGLLNYQVVERRKEIGVRMALGASRGRTVGLVLRSAAWMVAPGLVLGAAGAWGVTRLLKSMLYGVKPLDPWVCGLSLVLLTAAALAAAVLPARRAAGVDPLVALRQE